MKCTREFDHAYGIRAIFCVKQLLFHQNGMPAAFLNGPISTFPEVIAGQSLLKSSGFSGPYFCSCTNKFLGKCCIWNLEPNGFCENGFLQHTFIRTFFCVWQDCRAKLRWLLQGEATSDQIYCEQLDKLAISWIGARSNIVRIVCALCLQELHVNLHSFETKLDTFQANLTEGMS